MNTLTSPNAVLVLVAGVDVIAGRLIHPPLVKRQVAIARAEPNVRLSHAVSRRAHEALPDNDLKGFAEVRADDVDRLLRSF